MNVGMTSHSELTDLVQSRAKGGVFLTVLGAVMLMLFSLSRIARYAGQSVNLEPMDYDPADRVKPLEGGKE